MTVDLRQNQFADLMKSQVLRCIAFGVVIVTFPPMALGANDVLTRFLSEYPNAARKVEEAYSRLMIEQAREAPDGTGQPTVGFYRMMRSEDSVRLESGGSKDDLLDVCVATPKRSFRLGRKAASDPFALNALGTESYLGNVESIRRKAKLGWFSANSVDPRCLTTTGGGSV